MEPELISVLIGIPVDFREFSSRVGISDWLAKFYQPHLTPAEQQEALGITWEEEYQPLVARPFQDLIERAKNLNIPVSTNATIDDLKNMCATREGTIIIFSHWKGPEILASDIHEDLDRETLELLVSGRGEAIAQRIQAELDKIDSPPKQSIGARLIRRLWASDSSRPHSVREILSAAIEDPLAETLDGIDEVVESESVSRARCRDALDLLLTGLITPGNRLELFDGMHSKETIELKIAKEFEGVLDLTTCTSTYLADYISARRKQCIRTVQFPTVQKFDRAVNCVALTLEIAVRKNISYQEARLLANQVLTAEVLNLSRERNLKPRI